MGWTVMAPPDAHETGLLQAQAATADQQERVGDQTADASAFSSPLQSSAGLRTDARHGVQFAEPPRQEPYGTVAISKTSTAIIGT